MYRAIRPILFAADAELVHQTTISLLGRLAGNRIAAGAVAAAYRVHDRRLESECFGIRFPNPIGLAAGLDKDGLALPAWQALGFGFSEVGSVTAHPQPGNPRPRLFRVAAHGALINRMGFNNDGAARLARRLSVLRGGGDLTTPVLVNVGKSRVVALADAPEDYRHSLRTIWPHAQAAVLNVSSPNTPGLRSLQEPDALGRILAVCDELQAERPLPVLLKLAPDLADAQLESIVELASSHGVAGLVAVNTTTERPGLSAYDLPEGGLSGRPLAARSLAVLRFLAGATPLPLVSVGGISSADDVILRLRAGASLVELYTGFIFGGPATVREMLLGVLRHLEREGIPDLPSLIGIDR